MGLMIRSSLLAAITLGLAVPAVATTVYEWVTEDGSHAYSDSQKRIPKRYQSQAKKRTLGSLTSYERWTPSDRRAKGHYADRLEGNLDRLRAMNASLEPRDAVGTRAPVRMRIQTGRGGDGLDVPVAGEGPVVVEKIRTKFPSDDSTRAVTVIRQGGEVIAVIVAPDNTRDIVEVPAHELWQGDRSLY